MLQLPPGGNGDLWTHLLSWDHFRQALNICSESAKTDPDHGAVLQADYPVNMSGFYSLFKEETCLLNITI
jgi:hypothetical protein